MSRRHCEFCGNEISIKYEVFGQARFFIVLFARLIVRAWKHYENTCQIYYH